MWRRDGARHPACAPLLALCLLLGTAPSLTAAPEQALSMHEHTHGSEQAAARYTCPMHPQVQSPTPGRCPICGMDLALAPNGDTGPDTHDTAAPPAPAVSVTAHAAQVLSLRTAPVVTRAIAPRVSTWARTVADSSNERIVSAPAEGWIRALHVDRVGMRVVAGTPLFEIYAPELQQRQRDYIDTLNRRDQMLATLTSMDGQNGQLLASLARERLRLREQFVLLGIARASLDDIERLRRVSDTLTVVATSAGQVTALDARSGQAVAPGEALYRLLDTDSAVLDVMLSPRQRATLAAPVELRVEQDSTLFALDVRDAVFNPRAQAYGVRIVVAGLTQHAPGEVLAVSLQGPAQTLPAVPRAAVLEDSEGSFVMVADAQHGYRARRVSVAVRDADWVGIEHGLDTDEMVVVDGQYLLDAAATLEASFDNASER